MIDHKRRLDDKFVMIDVRLDETRFELFSRPVAGADLNAIIGIEYSQPERASPTPSQPQFHEHLTTSVTLSVSVTSDSEDAAHHFDVSARIAGIFGFVGDAPLSEDEVSAVSSCLVRLLFPLARAEVSRSLRYARLTEVPVPWDIGLDGSAVALVNGERLTLLDADSKRAGHLPQ